jgi:hypothetical protein
LAQRTQSNCTEFTEKTSLRKAATVTELVEVSGVQSVNLSKICTENSE